MYLYIYHLMWQIFAGDKSKNLIESADVVPQSPSTVAFPNEVPRFRKVGTARERRESSEIMTIKEKNAIKR